MAKMTKTQKKNLLTSIRSKAFRLIESDCISLADYDKISQVVKRGLKKLM